jgi:hypothetical protein
MDCSIADLGMLAIFAEAVMVSIVSRRIVIWTWVEQNTKKQLF